MQHPSSTKIQSEKERSASLNTFYEIFHPLKCVSSKRNVFGDAVHIRKRGVNVAGTIIDATLRGIRRVEIFAGIYGTGTGNHG